MKILVNLLIAAVAIVILEKLLPGVSLDPLYKTAVILAVVLTILNALVKPVIVILTIPITIITLGLFLFVINALVVLLADRLLDGFAVSSFWTALLFSILLSFLQSILQSIFVKDKEK